MFLTFLLFDFLFVSFQQLTNLLIRSTTALKEKMPYHMFKSRTGLVLASINIIVTCNARTGRMLLGENVVIVGLHATASFRIMPQNKNT